MPNRTSSYFWSLLRTMKHLESRGRLVHGRSSTPEELETIAKILDRRTEPLSYQVKPCPSCQDVTEDDHRCLDCHATYRTSSPGRWRDVTQHDAALGWMICASAAYGRPGARLAACVEIVALSQLQVPTNEVPGNPYLGRVEGAIWLWELIRLSFVQMEGPHQDAARRLLYRDLIGSYRQEIELMRVMRDRF